MSQQLVLISTMDINMYDGINETYVYLASIVVAFVCFITKAAWNFSIFINFSKEAKLNVS